jgi:hypothetical protein
VGWLVGNVLASLVAAVIVVRIFDYIFAGVTGSVVNVARAGVFVAAWSGVTARAGMHGFASKVRQLRAGNAAMKVRLDAVTKGERR